MHTLQLGKNIIYKYVILVELKVRYTFLQRIKDAQRDDGKIETKRRLVEDGRDSNFPLIVDESVYF